MLCMCDFLAMSKCVMLVWLFAYYFTLSVLDSSDTGCFKEGKIFEYQEEEDQGQANQVKPSKLVAYPILVLLTACFINV
jgi:hypothetical protein